MPSPSVNERLDNIMATQAEHAAALMNLKSQVDKVLAETVTKDKAQEAKELELLARIAALEAAIAAGGRTSPEVDAALLALKGAVKTSDDVVADPT